MTAKTLATKALVLVATATVAIGMSAPAFGLISSTDNGCTAELTHDQPQVSGAIGGDTDAGSCASRRFGHVTVIMPRHTCRGVKVRTHVWSAGNLSSTPNASRRDEVSVWCTP